MGSGSSDFYIHMPPARKPGSNGKAAAATAGADGNAAKCRRLALDDDLGESSSTASVQPPLASVEHVLPPLARCGLSASYDASRSPVASVLNMLATANSSTLGGTVGAMPRPSQLGAAAAPASSRAKRPAEPSTVVLDDDEEDGEEERRPRNFQARMAAVRGESPPAKRMRATEASSPRSSPQADAKPPALTKLNSSYFM